MKKNPKAKKISNSQLVVAKNGFERIIKERSEEIEKQRKFYNSIIENIPNMIFVKDAKNLKFELFNSAGEKLLGQKRKDLLGKSDYDFFPKKEADFFVKKDREVLKSGKLLDIPEEPIQTKGGQRILHTKKIPLYDEVGRPEFLLGISEDITERKRLENELKEYTEGKLKESEARFRAILDSTFHFTGLMDLRGYLIFANQTALNFAGVTIKEASSVPFWETKWWKGDKARVTKLKQSIAKAKKGEVIRYEVELNGRENTTAIMDFTLKPIFDKNGKVTMMVPEASDITEHKKYEEEIKQSEKKYSTLFENSIDGLLVIQDGLIKMANKSLENMSGYSLKDVMGKPFIDMVAPSFRKMVADIHIKRMKGEKVPNRYEFEILIKNNGTLAVEANNSVIYFDGRPAAMSVIRDISKAKQIDRIKSEFISVASHQLRSPLTGIKWFSQLLVDQKVGKLSDKQIDFIQQIYNSNERMIRLVNDLLDVSHIETGQKFSIEKKPGNIITLINNVISEQKISSPKKNIQIELDKACPSKLVFSFDNDKIYQVISNLINNSIKYSPRDKKIIINIDCKSNEVQFVVRDFGFGIPKHQQDRVFQKFFRADNIVTVSTEGTGLGLYIAKSIVEAHGGKMWFESEENKGTTFYFTLPLKDKKNNHK